MSVSIGCDDLKNSVVDGQERDVKGATTQVEDKNIFLSLLLVHAVGNGSSGRFVDNAHHVESGNDTSILGGLALGIVEILCEEKSIIIK